MVAMNVRNIKVQMKYDMFGAFSEMFFLSKCHITSIVLHSDKLIFNWQSAFVCVGVCVGGGCCLHIMAISN
jgi:hypothetical protein